MKKILFCLLAFYIPVSIVIAQNTTNSPTSMFGLGELSTGEGGQYAGLGGTGIALRGNNFLNNANPASLTELTEQRFQIDAGIMGAYQIYSQRGASNRSVTGNLNNLSIGCRIMPRWYGAIFMAPVSSVGYAITLDEEVAGTNGGTISSLFQGEGGLSKMGISTAYLFGKRFSVGTNLSYVTGTITQTETQGTATEETSSYKHTFYADFGVQYKWAIDRERSFVAGAVYGYSQDLSRIITYTLVAVREEMILKKPETLSPMSSSILWARSFLQHSTLDGNHRLQICGLEPDAIFPIQCQF